MFIRTNKSYLLHHMKLWSALIAHGSQDTRCQFFCNLPGRGLKGTFLARVESRYNLFRDEMHSRLVDKDGENVLPGPRQDWSVKLDLSNTPEEDGRLCYKMRWSSSPSFPPRDKRKSRVQRFFERSLATDLRMWVAARSLSL